MKEMRTSCLLNTYLGKVKVRTSFCVCWGISFVCRQLLSSRLQHKL